MQSMVVILYMRHSASMSEPFTNLRNTRFHNRCVWGGFRRNSYIVTHLDPFILLSQALCTSWLLSRHHLTLQDSQLLGISLGCLYWLCRFNQHRSTTDLAHMRLAYLYQLPQPLLVIVVIVYSIGNAASIIDVITVRHMPLWLYTCV